MALNIFEDFIRKHSQVQTTDQAMDPNQLQLGQMVYDNTTQDEYVVVEDDPATTHKVLMPSNQQGTTIPEGVKSVDDSELATSYTVQQDTSQTTAKKAQDDVVDWDDIGSVVTDLVIFTRKKDMQGVTSSVEELTNIILSYIEMPEDMDMGSMFASKKKFQTLQSRKVRVLPGFVKQ